MARSEKPLPHKHEGILSQKDKVGPKVKAQLVEVHGSKSHDLT